MNGCKVFVATVLAGAQIALVAPALAASPQQGGAAMSVPLVWRAQDVHDAFSVSAHITYTDTGSAYQNLSKVISRLQSLGITTIRDSIPTFAANDARLQLYKTMLSQGIKMLLVSIGNVGDPGAKHMPPTPGFASLMDAMQYDLEILEKAYPNQIIGVEGLNEPTINDNDYTFHYKDLSGAVGVAQHQIDLYNMVNGSKLLNHINVWEFAINSPPYGKAQYEEVYAANQKVMNAFDVASVGVYGGTWCPEFEIKQSIVDPFDVDFENHAFVYGPYNPSLRGLPGGVKETGLTSAPGGIPALGISDYAIQAKMLPYTLLDTLKLGSQHTNIYELGDVYPDPTLTRIGYHFGLFDNQLNPKPVVAVLQRMLAHLQDTASDAKTFTPDHMNVSVHEFPLQSPIPHVVPSGYSLATEKSDGTVQVLVWWEPKIYAAGVDLDPPALQPINVGLSKNCQQTEVYDPNTDTTVEGPSNTNMIPVALPDHAVIAVCKGAF